MKEITEEQNFEIGNVITKAEAFVKENQKKIIMIVVLLENIFK